MTNNIIFTPGEKGSIVFKLHDGTELLQLSASSLTFLGESIPLNKVRDLIRSLKESDPCSCPLDSVILGGCICGGS